VDVAVPRVASSALDGKSLFQSLFVAIAVAVELTRLSFGWVVFGHAGGHLLGHVVSGAHVFNWPVRSLQSIKL
jgi:hypothetical protein